MEQVQMFFALLHNLVLFLDHLLEHIGLFENVSFDEFVHICLRNLLLRLVNFYLAL
jgi:hypothetical protein